MSGQSLVDLLLVRLRKDEEKETVRQMLISILGMSAEEAADSVSRTPVLLPKSLPMEEARVIQERMYPFLDLLPREYGGSGSEVVPDPPIESKAEEPPEVDGQDGSFVREFEDDVDLMQKSTGEKPEIPYDALEGERDDGLLGDDAFVITSASDEMLTIDRCHVCGRTPTTVEKLAPCRTCGALTCSDCFDRIVHVCSKCASEGRMIDRPIKGEPEYRRHDETEIEEPVIPEARTGRRRISPVLFVLLGIAVLAAAFYFLDPLSLFSDPAGEGSRDSIPDPLLDTLSVSPLDSDSSTVQTHVRDSVSSTHSDSLRVTPVDHSGRDSVHARTAIPLVDLRLPPDFVIPEELSTPTLLLSSPVEGLEILADSLTLISYKLSCLLSAASIQSDGLTMVRTPDGSELLILSILHAEPMQERMRFVGALASLLNGSSVDQLVIYYRESIYHTPELFSLVADSFRVIAGTIGPGFIQSRQASLPETWEIVSGPIMDWMIQLN